MSVTDISSFEWYIGIDYSGRAEPTAANPAIQVYEAGAHENAVAVRPEVAAEMGDDASTLAATIDRYPYWPHWLPMLRIMSRHGVDCLRYAPVLTSRIVGAWLRHMDRD